MKTDFAPFVSLLEARVADPWNHAPYSSLAEAREDCRQKFVPAFPCRGGCGWKSRGGFPCEDCEKKRATESAMVV